MSKTGATDFSCKKAFELSYALFRVAAIAKSQSFAEALEEKATFLLNSVLSEDYENARATLKHIDYFMRLGADAGLLHFQNAEVIIKEGNGLYAAIAVLPEPATLQELNLDKFFSKSPLQDKAAVPAIVPAKRTKIPAKVDSTSSPQEELPESDDSIPIKSPIRQSAILERLRQNGNCRSKELQELLPEISERTLRYDLQSLIDKSAIERIGSGKHSFYQFKNQVSPVIELPGVSSVVL